MVERICATIRPAQEIQPWRWAERHVVVPLSASGQKWDSKDAIFIREIMESVADESVNEITCMCSAQSAKTLTILCILLWIIDQDPGPILWVTKSVQEARKLAKTRLGPMLEKCAPVAEKLPKGRGEKNTCEIYFPGAPLIITGSESEASLQSTPFRYIILDEARAYKPGAMEMVSKRTRSYTYNYKKIIISTPADEHDAIHVAFLSGDQRHFEIQCPNQECNHFQELVWKEAKEKGGIKWDTTTEDVITLTSGETVTGRVLSESIEGAEFQVKDGAVISLGSEEVAGVSMATKPDGKYNFDRLKQTVRYECEACGCRIHDNPFERKLLSGSERPGRWVVKNPKAPSNHRSYTWGALLPWWTSWNDQIKEFLTAKGNMKWGSFEAMKDHITETRGLPWTDRLRYAHDEKFIHLRLRDYDPRSTWDQEVRRFATIDVQGKQGRHYYVVIRAWGLYGASRLLYWAKVWSIEEVRQLLVEWNVNPDNVAIDCANWSSEVYKYVIESGYRWKAFRGDEKEFFRIADRNFMFTTSTVDPAIGTTMERRVRPIEQTLWSKPSALDRMANFQRGLYGDWQLPQASATVQPIDVPGSPEEIPYALQVTAYDRIYRTDRLGVEHPEWRKKREDHYASCELMQIICAARTEILSPPRDPLFAKPNDGHVRDKTSRMFDHLVENGMSL